MSSRLPALGPRGEGWVALQVAILGVLAWAGTLGPAWDGGARLLSALLGSALLVAGGMLVARGLLDLRGNLTALPHPRAGATLVDRGAYHRVRHPIYGGLVLGAFGWGLVWASPVALAIAVLLLGFFDLKSRREEAWLVEHFTDYPEYRTRTRRLIPFVY